MTAPGWNLPFEEHSAALPLTLDNGTLVAGGITVMAALTETPLGRFPVVVLQFDVGPGQPMPSVALLMDADHLRNLPALVEAAVAAAIRKAAGR